MGFEMYVWFWRGFRKENWVFGTGILELGIVGLVSTIWEGNGVNLEATGQFWNHGLLRYWVCFGVCMFLRAGFVHEIVLSVW